LLAANGWNAGHTPARGELIRIPMPASRADFGLSGAVAVAANPAAIAVAAGAAPPSTASNRATSTAAGSESASRSAEALPAPIAENVPPPATTVPSPAAVKAARQPREPVSERQTTNSDSLLPVASPTGNSDTTDYAVRADNTVIVQPDETLGHFADWTGVDSPTLRALNKLHKNAMVTQGRPLKVDLSRVTADEFLQARRAYHRHLQEEYFAGHRIAGTVSYTVKRGDALWTIVQQHDELPLWLVSQYNPDVNLRDIRPGTPLTLPHVVAINRQ
jgi:membrane-bound lytic murein transglycosylase D